MMRKQRKEPKTCFCQKRKQILSVNEELDSLRTLRKELAEAEGVPPYVVFPTRPFSDVRNTAVRQEAFLEVSGGQCQLEKYGDAFIDAMEQWKSSHRPAQCSHPLI